MSMQIKLFKLVSGEEIIGEVVEASDDNLYSIDKPMVFKTSTMMDNQGYPYDVTILKDWMIRTDTKIAHIPKNQISFVSDPNEQTIKLYNLELKRIENSEGEEIVNTEDIKDEMGSIDEQNIDQIMNNFLNSISDISNESDFSRPKKSSRRKRRKKSPPPGELNLESFIPDELKKRPMIYLSMVIPPEAIMNLITAGILDPEQLLAMIDEVKKKNKFTGDEKKRDDFGNKFSDWNPDPESEDY